VAAPLRPAPQQPSPSAPQDLDQLFQFQPHLVDELLALIEVDLRVVAGEAVAGPADGEALFVQEAPYLADDQNAGYRAA
jgi:hypothetical protein